MTPHVHLDDRAIARALITGASLPDVGGCARCAASVAEARETAATFARAVRPRTLPAIEARLARRRFAWFGVAVAALGVVLVGLALTRGVAGTTGTIIAAKGGPTLRLVASHAAGTAVSAFAVESDTRLAPGDAIRFVLDVADDRDRYLLVVSVDGAGQINVYYPYGGTASVAIDPAQHHVVPDGSIVLDASPGPERIWALISERPIAVDAVRAQLAAIAAGGPAALRVDTSLVVPGARQASAWFEKLPASLVPERIP